MLKITGYSDKYSAHPGEEVKFYVNAEYNDSYEVQLVRLIHGDTNPEGPGYKEAEIDASCNGNYQGKNQRIHGGSYIVIPQHDNLNLESFTMQAYIFQQPLIKVDKVYLPNLMKKIKKVMVCLLMKMDVYLLKLVMDLK